MKEEIIAEITSITKKQISAIDEEQLPQIFTNQVDCLKQANQKYSIAEENEKRAREKVVTALMEADKLIESTKNIGGNIANQKQLLWIKYTSNKDEIEALKENLIELINHSEHSAEAQKNLAEVLSALMESQASMLQLQKAYLEYQEQIANATKFVFGLSAYSMATNQSILIKLKAILSGASEEQLGELAQQQLFLALDQIRNQESIITRINENNNLIQEVESENKTNQEQISKIKNAVLSQNDRISAYANNISEQGKITNAQHQKIEELLQRFDEQEKSITANAQILVKHENKLIEQQNNDDLLFQILDECEGYIKEQQNNNDLFFQMLDEHDKKISANSQNLVTLDEDDKQQKQYNDLLIYMIGEHDNRINSNSQEIVKHKEYIKEHQQKSEILFEKLNENENRLSSNAQKLDNHEKMIVLQQIKYDDFSQKCDEHDRIITENLEKTNTHIVQIENKYEQIFDEMNESIRACNEYFGKVINSTSTEIYNSISEIKTESDTQIININNKLEEIKYQIESQNKCIKEKIWKIAVSVIALTSLVLNVLQYIGKI